MPELPDVESFRKYMHSTSLRKTIKSVDILNRKILGKINPDSLKKSVKGTRFKLTKRHGKNLFAKLSNNKWLTMHFGMTGYLKYYKNEDEAPRYTRILFNFDNGYHLAYNCVRMLGRVDLIDDLKEYLNRKKLGPDPLEDKISFKDFNELFSNRSGVIKTTLMNQNILAGIGNIYADEILFQAGIHPATNVQKLKKDNLQNIYQKMNSVLKKAISVDAELNELPKSFLTTHRKAGKDCPKCEGKIKKMTIGGRSSYFCSKHQKKK